MEEEGSQRKPGGEGEGSLGEGGRGAEAAEFQEEAAARGAEGASSAADRDGGGSGGGGEKAHGADEGGDEDGQEQEEEEEEEEEEDDDDEEEEGEEDEEDDDEEDDEDDDDDDEEEEEPQLKYQRLGNSVPDILKRESASVVKVHDKYVALGTREGWIYILDFQGVEIRRFGAHTAAVNDLCFDTPGECIASCSDDGTVVLNGLASADCESFTYQRPVKSLALHSKFARKGNRQFVSGGLAGQLLLNEKGWFTNKDKVVHSGEGPVYAIAWADSLIAWANDTGVKIYDNVSNQRITYIDRPKGSPRADAYRCHLCWETPSTLLIGWADYVKIAQVKERPARDGGASAKFVEIVCFFHTDYFICGISPMGENLVILAYVVDDEAAPGTTPGAQRPELRIVARNNDELSSDALSVHGFEKLTAKDYQLAPLPSQSLFYIVSPRDIVVAKSRDMDDHISWLLERRRFGQAVEEAEENIDQLKRHRLQDIGERYLGQLTEAREFDHAASLCPRLLKENAALWVKWIDVFSKIGQQKVIVPYIPFRNPQLKNETYSSLLLHFLGADLELLLKLVHDWPSSVYSVPTVIDAVKRRLEKDKTAEEERVLFEALAQLNLYAGHYDKTLQIYFKLQREDVFQLIMHYRLFDSVRDKVLALLRFNEGTAVKMLVNNTEKVPVAHVVPQLKDDRRLQHVYLDALFDKDPRAGSDFHELQVELYAELDYPKLLPFLRQSNHYRLETALALCERLKLYPEMVFVLGRMGNGRQALSLLLQHTEDVHQAIDFCVQQQDDDLWEDLIKYCLNHSDLVSPLLNTIGAHVDPVKVVSRIPLGMHIEGLREKLIKIIADYHLQMSLKEGCEHILQSDVISLAHRLHRVQKRGVRVDARSRCGLTSQPVVGAGDGDVVVMFGGKVYREDALATLCMDVISGGGGRGGRSVESRGGAGGGRRTNVSGGDTQAAARLVLAKGYSVEDKRLVRSKESN